MLTSFRGATIQFARQAGRLGDLVQPGTSAIEQYTPRGSQGPWTDVYAAAATIVHAITGNEVPAAPKRLDDRDPVKDLLQDAGAFSSPAMRDALSHALTVDPSKRLQTVEALRNALVDASEKYDASTASYIITPVAPQKGAEEEEEVVEEFASDRTSRAPARPTRAPEPERSNTALLVGLPILLVAGLVGGYFAFSGGGGSTGASGGAIGTYEDFRMQADSLYYLRNLAEAKALYNQALGERPEDQYVTQRLRQIEEMQAQSSEMRFQNRMARGDSLLTAGNALLEKGNVTEAARVLGQASAAFEMAAEVKPDNETVDERLSVVEESFTRLAEARGSEGGNTDDLYALFREQGNEQMAAGNYRAARRKFEEALDFKPGDDYARQQLQRVQNQLARQESLRRFENLLTQALDLLDEEKPEEAQPLLAQAAEIYPDNKRLGEAMARAEQMASQSDEREQQYMAQRTAGDQAFSEERFADAARAYKKALDYRPGDEYAAQRLEEAQQEAEMMQLATTERRRQVERREKMKEEEKSDIYAVVDVQPQLVGGLAALHREVEYPRMAQKAGIEGRVYVQVTVNADGTVREAVVTKGIGGGCDEEAKRVLENATFEPAQVDGRPVAARTTQWIQFRLQN
jgi:TonB family protein